MSTAEIVRADSSRVTNILSEAFSVTLPNESKSEPTPISPEKVDEMDYPLAWLQEVMWETYPGFYGPNTLLKEVDYATAECDECGGEGWVDYHGDTICTTCGLVMNDKPMMVAQDYDTIDRSGDPNGDGGYYVFFNVGAKPALNSADVGQPSAPNVQ